METRKRADALETLFPGIWLKELTRTKNNIGQDTQ
jgi:hypothetical protein